MQPHSTPRQTPNFQFVASFVDALTVRPFLSDLRRMRRATQGLRLIERTDEEILRDTANAA